MEEQQPAITPVFKSKVSPASLYQGTANLWQK